MKRTLLILFSAFLLAGCFHNKKASIPSIEKSRPTINEPVNTVPLSERVYAVLSIKRDGTRPLGKELELTIAEAKDASEISYDVEYQTGTTIQGGGGSVNPAKEDFPFTATVFLGTCSAGGACSYHKDVSGGTVIVRFKGSPVGNLKGEWSYAEPGNDGKFSSRDGKFQLDATKLKSSFVIISQALGLPATVQADVIGGPYHLDGTGTIGSAQLTMRLSEASSSATLWRWVGTWDQFEQYQKVESFVSDKTLTATITETGTYLVTK